ncbi:hypothetical protein K502DRAFT_326178 [Neoconidiobolus thromboides FSU 785]|nr:hypothetical protein K502DRAFT_326178 [Neoconidiobolus thromboides FSU 785]
MDQQYFHNNTRYNNNIDRNNNEIDRLRYNNNNEVEDSVVLPPIKNFKPYYNNSNNQMPQLLLPRIQLLSPANNMYNSPKNSEFSSRSKVFNLLQVSAIQQSQAVFNFSTWLKSHRDYLASFHFYLNQLDGVTSREVAFDLEKLGGKVEATCNELVTHIVFLPNSERTSLNPHINKIRNDSVYQRTTTSNAPSRFVSPLYSTYNHRLPNSGHLDFHIPPIKELDPAEPSGISYKPIFDDKTHNYNDNSWRQLRPLEPIMLPPPTPSQHHFGLTRCYDNNTIHIPSIKIMSYEKPTLKKSDFHFFKHPFVLVEDATGHYRPAVAAEYSPSKDANEIPWPKLYIVPSTRCPFIKCQSKKKNINGTEKRRAEAALSKLTHSRLSNSTRSLVLPPINIGNNDLLDSIIDPIVISKRFCNVDNNDPSTHESKRLSALPNSHLQYEKTAIIPKTLPPIPHPIRLKASAAPAPNNIKKPGYCENCKTKFNDIEEHIQSRVHREFSVNDNNFCTIDLLLSRLVRRPNPQLISMTTPSSSSPSHYLSRSIKDYSIDNQLSSGPAVSITQPYEYPKYLPL